MSSTASVCPFFGSWCITWVRHQPSIQERKHQHHFPNPDRCQMWVLEKGLVSQISHWLVLACPDKYLQFVIPCSSYTWNLKLQIRRTSLDKCKKHFCHIPFQSVCQVEFATSKCSFNLVPSSFGISAQVWSFRPPLWRKGVGPGSNLVYTGIQQTNYLVHLLGCDLKKLSHTWFKKLLRSPLGVTSRFATQLDSAVSAIYLISVYNLKQNQFCNVAHGALLPHTYYTLCGPRNGLTSNNFTPRQNISYTM